MSEQPPRDPHDNSLGGIVDEVVSQVRGALDEADVTSQHSQELLLDGLRDVMQMLMPQMSPEQKASGGRVPPDVTVVEGGRGEDVPPTEGKKPELKVAAPAESHDEAPPPSADAPEAERPRVVTKVSVHKAQSSGRDDGRPRLFLEATDADHPLWRSVFRGSSARPYRLTAERGVVRVSLDGLPADEVVAGSSLDVEARVIQVSARDGAATLRYARLPS